jgi:salicylate---CoA ligase
MNHRPETTLVGEGVVPWPDDAAAEYVAAGWWRGRPLGAELFDAADARPDAVAVVDGDTRLTYADLTARADGLAARLVDELGIRPGERIVVQLTNCWEFVVLLLACLRAGIVPVMALPAHRRHELAYLVQHGEAVAIAVPGVFRGFDHADMATLLVDQCPTLSQVLVVSDGKHAGTRDLTALSEPPEDPTALRARWDTAAPASRDVAVFLLSGGTTGLPKLIARTHDDYAYNAYASAQLCGFDASTVYLTSLPASHNFPLACPGLLGALLMGGRVVMLSSPEPDRAFAIIAAEGVTATAAVPAVAQRWVRHAQEHGSAQLRTLTLLQVGGARLADEIARQVRPVLGATLQQVFGMAEGLLNYTRLDDPDDVICTSQGRPLSPGDDIRLVDAFDRDVPDGQPGSLLTRGPYTPRGYYRAAEQNARAFTADGWYRSGDIVRRRPDGNLVVEGRDKDMINRGGEKISAEEVENLIYQLPQVAQVAAIAMPDTELGERICVYVVLRADCGLRLDEIRDAMRGADVAKYKWPEHLEIVADIPTTKVGKIDKKALRDDIATRIRRTAEPPAATADLPAAGPVHRVDPAAHTTSQARQEVDMTTLGTIPVTDRFDTPEHQRALAELYHDFDAVGMTPLWRTREDLMTTTPQPKAVPHLWRWSQLLPLAARSADLVPVGRGGERRAIGLGNPGLPGDPYATPTLWAAIQYLAPRENAPEHRHSQSAFRFVVDGEGVWTVVDGDPVAMRRGDLLLTPGWHFHGHQNVSDKPMAWLDGLDIPFISTLDQGFFEFGPDIVRDAATPHRSRGERLWSGPGLTPVSQADVARTSSPLMAYRWEHTDAALAAQLDLEDEGQPGVADPGHAAVRFTNPTTGGDALTTMRTEMHRLRPATTTPATRTTASSVWQVFSGGGTVTMNGEIRALEHGDVFVVPSWTQFSLQAADQLDLFTFSDAPILDKLALLRTEVSV